MFLSKFIKWSKEFFGFNKEQLNYKDSKLSKETIDETKIWTNCYPLPEKPSPFSLALKEYRRINNLSIFELSVLTNVSEEYISTLEADQKVTSTFFATYCRPTDSIINILRLSGFNDLHYNEIKKCCKV